MSDEEQLIRLKDLVQSPTFRKPAEDLIRKVEAAGNVVINIENVLPTIEKEEDTTIDKACKIFEEKSQKSFEDDPVMDALFRALVQ